MRVPQHDKIGPRLQCNECVMRKPRLGPLGLPILLGCLGNMCLTLDTSNRWTAADTAQTQRTAAEANSDSEVLSTGPLLGPEFVKISVTAVRDLQSSCCWCNWSEHMQMCSRQAVIVCYSWELSSCILLKNWTVFLDPHPDLATPTSSKSGSLRPKKRAQKWDRFLSQKRVRIPGPFLAPLFTLGETTSFSNHKGRPTAANKCFTTSLFPAQPLQRLQLEQVDLLQTLRQRQQRVAEL